MVLGGGIANTFLAARGCEVGASLHEPELLEAARKVERRLAERGGVVWLPEDVVIADRFAADADTRICDSEAVPPGWMILDIGPRSRDSLASVLARVGTIVWNGPVGVFELDAFAAGTRALAEAITASPAYSIAGGGDTLAAIARFGVGERASTTSPPAAAPSWNFYEGRELPAVAALRARARARKPPHRAGATVRAQARDHLTPPLSGGVAQARVPAGRRSTAGHRCDRPRATHRAGREMALVSARTRGQECRSAPRPAPRETCAPPSSPGHHVLLVRTASPAPDPQ